MELNTNTNANVKSISSLIDVNNENEQGVKFKEKLGYSLGDLGSCLIFTVIGTFLTFYYTDIVGIPAGILGTILLVSRIFDGVLDIGMGVLVDRTKSRHGKARPWILWMAIPFAISGVIAFSVPDIRIVGKVIFIIISYNILNLIYTSINIPYGVMNSLITQDQYQRSILNIFRMIMAVAGTIAVSLFTLPVVNAFGGGQLGWQITMSIFGAVGSILFFITFFSTQERVKPIARVNTRIPLKKSVNALFKNKYWGIMVVIFVLHFTLLGINGGVMIYFAKYKLDDDNLVGTLTLAMFIPILVGMLLGAPLYKKIGKRNMMITGCIIVIAGALFSLFDITNATIVIIGMVIKGIGLSTAFGSIFAMLADTIEYGEWKSGIRTEGLVYSAGSFGSKVGSGIASGIIGWVLSLGGYIGGSSTQTDSALFSITSLFIYAPLIIAFLEIILLSFYKLDKEYLAIIEDLNEKKVK